MADEGFQELSDAARVAARDGYDEACALVTARSWRGLPGGSQVSRL
jgi:hypothetical protein